MLNAISVDVEEYFHAANLEPLVGPARWHSMPSRVVESTDHILNLFAQTNTKGTFFILGYVAQRHPTLIRRIAAEGHEIASHGYGHRLAYTQTPKSFYRDIRRTKLLLEDLTGHQVKGYRAPNFSIIQQNLWAYDELIRAGYLYDSSLYPVWHPRYANLARARVIEFVWREEQRLLIVPLATAALGMGFFKFSLPVAGGAYWRLLPEAFNRWGLQRRQNVERQPSICYLHPWEVDTDQPRVAGLSPLTSLRHYGGIGALPKLIVKFNREFNFSTIAQVIAGYLEGKEAPLES